MKPTIAVAGATGNLGGRIVNALLAQGAEVRALVRSGAGSDKLKTLNSSGAHVVQVDMSDASALARACAGASCVVSALQGLHDVIVGVQSVLLEATIAAGVPRFIPSDYAADFTRLEDGENRNFDFRRAFHVRLARAPIASTSILNGAFMDMLAYGMPLLDRKSKSVSYWENADQPLDFTTMDDTAAFTAAAALDPSTPAILRIAGEEISARKLATLAGELAGEEFKLVRAGSLDELSALIERERAAHPESEGEEYPRWQQMQYMRSMFSGRAKLESLDNDRYPNLKWTKVRGLLSTHWSR